jgi:arylsulfatase A-like enzyme
MPRAVSKENARVRVRGTRVNIPGGVRSGKEVGMARRTVWAGILAAALGGCAGAPGARPGDGRVNFLVFIADDQGEGDLGCYGHPVLRTPHIDRIAREGVRFDRAFLTISSCSPSRASLLTGRYPHSTGAGDLHQPLPADQKTVARYLRAAGYHCMAAGKWHLGDAERAQWDRIVECPGARTAEVALKLLAERPPGKPFFFWVASVDPHRPYGEEDVPVRYDPAQVVVPPYLPDHPEIRKELARYYEEISRFDAHVGRILEALEREGELDRTCVIYLSDNGMPFPRAKTTLYDSGIRTPLLVRYPPLAPPGGVRQGLVSGVDVAPTILDLAGIAPDSMQGRSFAAMLRFPDAPGREAVFAEANWHDYAQFTRAVRTDRFLLVRNYYWDKPLWNSVDSIQSPTWAALLELERAGRLSAAQRFLFVEPRPFEELYDLGADPASLVNVADDPRFREELWRLRTRLDNWRVETGDVMPAVRRADGWTREGVPLPHNQPWYDEWRRRGASNLEVIK